MLYARVRGSWLNESSIFIDWGYLSLTQLFSHPPKQMLQRPDEQPFCSVVSTIVISFHFSRFPTVEHVSTE